MNVSAKQIMLVSLMLFSMFFGAGNLIFPPFLGQTAGSHLWPSLLGFIISAVGLPILGVVAIAKAGSFHALNSRVHPIFALIFPFIIYIAIGPGLAIPRAGSLAYEMGAMPFLFVWYCIGFFSGTQIGMPVAPRIKKPQHQAGAQRELSLVPEAVPPPRGPGGGRGRVAAGERRAGDGDRRQMGPR